MSAPNPSPSTIARALALFVRDQPRASGDPLTEEQHRRSQYDVAYTLYSCSDRDVLDEVAAMERRLDQGRPLEQYSPPR